MYHTNLDMLAQGTRVQFLPGSAIEGTGRICGVANTGALLGHRFIIELDKPIPTYDYTHITLSENLFEVIKDEEDDVEQGRRQVGQHANRKG